MACAKEAVRPSGRSKIVPLLSRDRIQKFCRSTTRVAQDVQPSQWSLPHQHDISVAWLLNIFCFILYTVESSEIPIPLFLISGNRELIARIGSPILANRELIARIRSPILANRELIARIGSPISPKSVPRIGLCTYCVNKYWVVVGQGLSRFWQIGNWSPESGARFRRIGNWSPEWGARFWWIWSWSPESGARFYLRKWWNLTWRTLQIN